MESESSSKTTKTPGPSGSMLQAHSFFSNPFLEFCQVALGIERIVLVQSLAIVAEHWSEAARVTVTWRSSRYHMYHVIHEFNLIQVTLLRPFSLNFWISHSRRYFLGDNSMTNDTQSIPLF